ncbi:hypothetical protein GJ689_10495 [Rhodoplanes serenus]|uniref:Uncharacterized protein n=1 Tax=Rhodoplanes serenus TaxID=200615 RepID=A0A9X4XK98_9BRAD|nr:hypothetical protein [Rhodoplanes serenus]MTW16633.1 hypothetical protein [Rhodoplanes serenus]
MKPIVTEAEIEAGMAEFRADERLRGLPPASAGLVRGIVRARIIDSKLAGSSASAPRPAPSAAAPAPVSPPPPSPAVLGERARAQKILALTPAGAEDEATAAIASGMPVAEFEHVIAAWAILEAQRRARWE